MTVADQIETLQPYVSEHKQQLIREVLHDRTRMITLVLEDIYHSQNASAVLRTSECYGIQDAYIIEKEHSYDINPRVVMGANKWLDLHYYSASRGRTTMDCYNDLREKGYKIYATTPGYYSVEIQEIVPDHKMAFVFGTELTGISEEAKEHADQLVHIPMRGFTESYNISVSAAIILKTIFVKLRNNIPENYSLTHEEKQDITLRWYKLIVKNSDLILKRNA